MSINKPTIEYLVDNIEDLEKSLTINSEQDSLISYGHEGCILKLLLDDRIWDYLNNESKIVRIVFPYIPQNRWDVFTKWIDKLYLTNWKGKLVLNDWGSLSYVSSKKSEKIAFGAGRFLGFSFAEVPYKDEYYRNQLESELDNVKLMEFVKNMNVAGQFHFNFMDEIRSIGATFIEVSDSDNEQFNNSLEHIKKAGIEVYVYKDWNLSSASRFCQSAKFRKKNVPDCFKDCKKIYKLRMDSVIHKQHLTSTPEVPDFFPSIYVTGNLFHTRVKNSTVSKPDGFILSKTLEREVEYV